MVGVEGEGEVCVGVSEGVSELGDHRESSSGTLTVEKGEDEESVHTREEETKEVQSSAESATLEALQQVYTDCTTYNTYICIYLVCCDEYQQHLVWFS